jgi:hypothetical protein
MDGNGRARLETSLKRPENGTLPELHRFLGNAVP